MNSSKPAKIKINNYPLRWVFLLIVKEISKLTLYIRCAKCKDKLNNKGENILELSFKDFVCQCCQEMSVCDFVDCFFKGSVTNAASAFNVSRQTMHSWINDDMYEIQVIYHEFDNGKATYDYVLKKQVKRVGAISKDFYSKVGHVYAVSNGSITKIGSSVNPEERAKKVARDIGFDDYSLFVSNPTVNYRTIESQVHKKLDKFKRENTIYQRECFSCSIDDAEVVIKSIIPDMISGPRLTVSGSIKSIHKAFEGKN